MNNAIDKFLKRSYPLLGTIVLIVIAQNSALAADTEAKPYQMGVLLNKAYGESIEAGKYERAITRMARHLERERVDFGAQNNLCVAFVKTHDLDKAATACDAAVARASKLKNRGLSTKKRRKSLVDESNREDLAIALSNRGVLLAVQGNEDQARKDFEAAASLGSRHTKIAAENLQRLRHSISSET